MEVLKNIQGCSSEIEPKGLKRCNAIRRKKRGVKKEFDPTEYVEFKHYGDGCMAHIYSNPIADIFTIPEVDETEEEIPENISFMDRVKRLFCLK